MNRYQSFFFRIKKPLFIWRDRGIKVCSCIQGRPFPKGVGSISRRSVYDRAVKSTDSLRDETIRRNSLNTQFARTGLLLHLERVFFRGRITHNTRIAIITCGRHTCNSSRNKNALEKAGLFLVLNYPGQKISYLCCEQI